MVFFPKKNAMFIRCFTGSFHEKHAIGRRKKMCSSATASLDKDSATMLSRARRKADARAWV